MIEEITNFSLIRDAGRETKGIIELPLYYNGQPAGTEIPGYVIEKQFKISNYYLLFTSYDCPFEESNEIILLDRKFNILSKRSVGAPLCSYLLQGVTPVSENKLLINYDNISVYLYILRCPVFKQRPFLFVTNAGLKRSKVIRLFLFYLASIISLYFLFPVSIAIGLTGIILMAIFINSYRHG